MAQTNTGHDATAEPLASFAASYQKRVDYAFRAVHMTATRPRRSPPPTMAAPPAYSYWDACSTGGRQGLISAQRFPQDFDGIVAGAPVLNFRRHRDAELWNGMALADTAVPLAKMKLVADAALRRCDAKDGLKDGLIDDPRLATSIRRATSAMRCGPGSRDLSDAGADRGDQEDLCGRAGRRQARAFRPGLAPRPPAPRSPARGPTDSGWDMWLIPPAGRQVRSARLRRQLRALLPRPSPTRSSIREVRLRQGHGEVQRCPRAR